MRSPCENYIKALLLHPKKYTTGTIIDLLAQEHLDFIGHSYIERLRSDLLPPRGFDPCSDKSKDSLLFLRKHQLYFYYHPNKAMKAAMAILHTPRAKEVVETLLLATDNTDTVLTALRWRGGQQMPLCTKEAIQLYGHYFWNERLFERFRVEELLRMRVRAQAESDDESVAQVAAESMKKVKKDPRYIVSTMPKSTQAQAVALFNLGLYTSDSKPTRLLEGLSHALAMRTFSAACSDPFDAPARYTAGVAGILQLEERAERMMSATGQIQHLLADTDIGYDDRPVITVKQLGEGNYTTDIVPAPVQK